MRGSFVSLTIAGDVHRFLLLTYTGAGGFPFFDWLTCTIDYRSVHVFSPVGDTHLGLAAFAI